MIEPEGVKRFRPALSGSVISIINNRTFIF
jgi:hypothetical protein